MKKIMIFLSVVSLFVMPLFADTAFNIFGGFTFLSMGQANDMINSKYNSTTLTSGGTKSKTNLGNGTLLGLDYGYSPFSGLSIGPRLEFLWSNGDIKASESGVSAENDYTAFMLPVLLGASYVVPLNNSFSLGGDAYFGYGVALGSYEEISTGDPSETENLNGGSFVGDFNIDAKYNITNSLNIGIKLGYRRASVPEMKASSDNLFMNVKKGDIFRDTQGNAVPFDYSGIAAGLNLGFVFQ